MVFLDEPLRLKEQGEAVELEFRESMEHRLEKGYLLPGPDPDCCIRCGRFWQRHSGKIPSI